ncbi:MAG: SDR family oxidoreductase [Mobilicoccus sp.]|nr:SDR family oxidoreductase [Mobilicoccus sp.]
MSSRLTGSTTIVTGASRGIGRAIAAQVLAEGGNVVITARKAEDLETTAREIAEQAQADGRVLAVAGKADDPAHREQVVAAALETFGSLDHLVNNAGINPAYGPLMQLDLDAARKITEVNAIGALAWVQAAHRAWMGEHGGSIVNVASVAGLRPAPGIDFYGASKAMLISLTQSLAVELAPSIRVNAVAPAVVKTRFAQALVDGAQDSVQDLYPLGRFGEPEDIAHAVTYLLSPDSAWVTGQVHVLDGGALLKGGV